MKKVLLLISATVLMIMGCAVSYNWMPTMMVVEKYPECKNETGQTDFVNCVKAIQEKEGKVR